jgi:hypothetical protein
LELFESECDGVVHGLRILDAHPPESGSRCSAHWLEDTTTDGCPVRCSVLSLPKQFIGSISGVTSLVVAFGLSLQPPVVAAPSVGSVSQSPLQNPGRPETDHRLRESELSACPLTILKVSRLAADGLVSYPGPQTTCSLLGEAHMPTTFRRHFDDDISRAESLLAPANGAAPAVGSGMRAGANPVDHRHRYAVVCPFEIPICHQAPSAPDVTTTRSMSHLSESVAAADRGGDKMPNSSRASSWVQTTSPAPSISSESNDAAATGDQSFDL